MAKQLTVNGEVYNYPENRDSPGWGEDGSAWAEAVTEVCGNVSGTGDILQTSAVINNGAGSAVDVAGLAFDPGVVRGSVVEYSVYRVTTGIGAMEKVEIGTMYVSYKSTAATFELTIVGSGGGGITFTINASGQIRYTTDTLTGSGYSGTMKFRARALTI